MEVNTMINDKEFSGAELNDMDLENVSGGKGRNISENQCGVDDGAVRRPKEELTKNQKIVVKNNKEKS